MTRIEIFADLACPWCYIAERRLDRAIAHRPGREVEKVWRPYMLQPDLPSAGVPWPEFVETKWGGLDQAQPMFERLSATAAADGLEFAWSRVATAPNTLDAHRLILLAERKGKEWQVAEALFRGYFSEGLDLGDRETLTRVARAEELDADEVKDWLEGGTGAREIEASRRAAVELGIEAVPFFVFDGKYAVSGAQPVELFLDVLDRCELRDVPVS